MDSDVGLLPIAVKREDPRYQRLMAATRDAAAVGYENVSMRELAETCHISLRTIYRRFCRSKDQLIAEAHLDGFMKNGLDRSSAAQCQHIRAVAASRIESTRGNVGAAALLQIREVLGLILDFPG